MKIELTKEQCESLLEFIQFDLLDFIRADTTLDNITWLQNMMDARRELQRAFERMEDESDEAD